MKSISMRKISLLALMLLFAALATSLTYEFRASNCVLPSGQLACHSLLAIEAILSWLVVLYMAVTLVVDMTEGPADGAAPEPEVFDISKMYWI